MQPKHRLVYDYLKREIDSGKVAPGERLPTEGEMSKLFAVSRPTAVRAFRDLEQEGLIERRRGSGSYVREQDAGPPPIFGVMMSGFFDRRSTDSNIFAHIFGEITDAGEKEGYSILFGSNLRENDPDKLIENVRELARRYAAQKVSGVFFVPLILPKEYSGINHEVAVYLRENNIPVVLLDRDIYDHPRRSDFDLVGLDNVMAGKIITAHLIEQGCRKIIFVGSSSLVPTVTARIEGYKHAMAEAGIDIDPGWIKMVADFHGRKVDEVLQEKDADAFICYNDDIAIFLMQKLREGGVGVPGDVMVAGIDDNEVSARQPVPLSTMRQPARHIGEAALKVMLEKIEKPAMPARTILFTPKLIARESTGLKNSQE